MMPLPTLDARTESNRMTARVDLHVHTAASFDCSADPGLVAQRCQALGLAPIVLTDHDTVAAATSLRRRGFADVLVGQEITTRDGELIGLFLQSGIEPGAPATDTAGRIKAQGGLVYLPHPLDPARRSLSAETIDRLVNEIDIVEVFNGRSTPDVNDSAAELCRHLGSVPGAGSDAHTLEELGGVYVELEAFQGPSDFLRKLDRARIVRNPSRARLRFEARVRGLVKR